MRTTIAQNQDFMDTIIQTSFLEDAISWIGENLDPEKVFPKEVLEAWAEAYGYIKEG